MVPISRLSESPDFGGDNMSDEDVASVDKQQQKQSKRADKQDAKKKKKKKPPQQEQQPHVWVWVGRVPSFLCVSENAIRKLFEEFGAIRSVKIHHDFVDMDSEGFLYLELASQKVADRVIAAVQSGSLDDGCERMQARLAIQRSGPPQFEIDRELTDLLLGRRQANLANPFSQHSVPEDEDDLMLQSLSQHSFGSQKKKRRKRSSRTSFLSVGDE